jgi:regulator of RNase E activity RraA
MMSEILNPEELEKIRQWPTCAISNAIEIFNVRPWNEGCMSSDVKCVFPDMEPMIGYAVTAVISAESPEGHRVSRPVWWEEILKIPEPRVLVIHDIDRPVAGCFWGEVQANIHKKLGCVGVVTDGTVRDLDEVHELGFHFFSSGVSVTHAYVHLVDVSIPVKVGGVVVEPGDLIMGDKHGVLSVPISIATHLPETAKRIEDWERNVIDYCKSKDFTLEGLKERVSIPKPVWPYEK